MAYDLLEFILYGQKGFGGIGEAVFMVKALVKYKVLNIIEKRQPVALSFNNDEILAEYENPLDARITYRNLIARVSDGATILNPTEKTVEVSL